MSLLRLAQYVVRRLPFFLLALKALWVYLLIKYGFKIGDYWYASELQAHSLAFCAVLAYYAYVGRHCLYLWACIFGLAGLNILNIAYYFSIIAAQYLSAYTLTIFLTCSIFVLIHAAKRLIKNN